VEKLVSNFAFKCNLYRYIECSKDLERVKKHVETLHHLEGCLLGVDKEAFTN
jgi:hypothetical protein